MAATRKSQSSEHPRSSGAAERTDAISLLRADHATVDQLLKQFEKLGNDSGEKATLVQQICNELTVHAAVEEEIFYPAVRAVIDDDALMDEATVEHMSAKVLMAALEGMEPGEDLYDAKVKVLGEYVRHHVREEHDEMFPKIRKAKLDLQELGTLIIERKQKLMSDLGMSESEGEGEDEAETVHSRRRSA